jgi:Trk-type K+ transport system membrane component
LFAILPLSDIMVASSNAGGQAANPENLNQMIRLAKIGRLYKLIKLTKLLRILKIVKEKSKLLKYVREVVKLGYGFERLVFFVLIFLLISHIVACMWIFVAKFANYEGTWMEGDLEEVDPLEQYLISFYFTVTTITTVGYGDISASSNGEKYFCILIMIIGVVSFSILSGSLANVL